MQIRHDYDLNGYVVLKDFLSTNEVLRLNDLVDNVYEQWRLSAASEIREHRLINMHSLTDASYFKEQPEERVKLFKAIAPTKLVELLDDLFETDIHFHNTQLFFNPDDEAQKPYWHRDLQFSPIADEVQMAKQHELLNLHVRIPLVKEVGVELLPGTHKRWDTPMERLVRFELDGHKNSEPLPESVLIELEPGDLLVFNAQMIHCGRYSGNPSRKALDLCVGSSHDLIDGSLDPKVLPTDTELKQLQHDVWYERSYQLTKG